MRALIVGYGRAGKRHARLLHDGGLADDIAIVDPHQARRDEAQQAGFEAHARLAPALERARFEIGIVATPSASHVAVGSALAQRGIPCVIEKPVGAPRQSLAPLHAAARTGTLVTVVSQHRFAPDLPALHELLRRAGTGRLVVRRNRSETYLRRAGADDSGASGIALTIGIHWLDILFSFFGAPRRVHVLDHQARFGVQVRCVAEIAWPGAEITFDAHWGEDVAELADELSLPAQGAPVRYREDCLHRGEDRCDVDKERLIALQLREVVDAVRGGGVRPRVSLDEAEGALRIAERLAC